MATEGIAGDPTLRDYAKRMKEFETFCLERDMEVDYQTPAKLEPSLLEYLDHLYLEEEEKSDVGGKLASALAHHYNQYVGLRQSQIMPTFARALKAFDKLNPSLSRETLPAPFVNALAGEQLRTRDEEGAHLTLLGLDTYLRPGIIIGLMEHNVINSVVIGGERRPTCLLVNLPSQGPSK